MVEIARNSRLIAEKIERLRWASRRALIAIAGPPASGKSTLAQATAAELSRRNHHAAVMPMDGFHLDNRLLEKRGLLARKGAPETFDFDGFLVAVRRVQSEPSVILPDFDRDREIAVAGSLEICRDTRIVLVEGNYLLLGESPWTGLAGFWTFSVFLSVSTKALEQRLRNRWNSYGLDRRTANAKIRGNDLVNAKRISKARGHADLVLSN
ncbi:MAG: nucleoside/nucleotide kinase family protein [Rhodobacteraceae bacterium]|nr:nucleoside/nucleotide kinase family protein [Paracoccaceae bacterium]MCY4140383.1 nucleoside/nucleotide kinase family protein [Paracoccaceae bacterium]